MKNINDKDCENWPCVKCGSLVKLLKPIHQIPPQIKCEKCRQYPCGSCTTWKEDYND